MNRDFNFAARLAFVGILWLTSCGSQAESTVSTTETHHSETTVISTAAPSETPGSVTSDQVLVVFDDDGSPDGTSALLYFLADPRAYVVSASISFGEAYPANYIQHIGRILDNFGIHDIQLGAGKASPLSGSNSFPDWIHEAADGFWSLPLPNADKTYPISDAASMMVSVISKSPEPVLVFISGPCTNLAQAFRNNPEIKSNIAAIYIMGGAIHTRGNIDDLIADTGNVTAEWNIYADPLAAKEVFQSGLDIFLVPLDATNKVKIDSTNMQQWREGTEISDLAAGIYEMLMTSTGKDEFLVWDLMTAAISIDPGLCVFEKLDIDVITESGENSGQTVVVDPGSQVINVCLEPDVEEIEQALDNVFSLN